MKDVIGSALAFAALAATNLATGVLAARLLGPGGRGELAAVMLWPQIVGAVGVAFVVDAVIHASAERPGERPRTAASGGALALLLSLPFAALAAAASALALAHMRPEVREAGLLYAAFVPLSLAATVGAAVFQGALRLGTWNALRVSVALGYAGFILVFLAAGRVTVATLAAASILANAGTLALTVVVLRRAGWLGQLPHGPTMRRFVRYCLPIACGSALVVLGERLDQILISQWQSETAFGLYVVAAGLAGAAGGFAGLLGAIAFPKVAGRATLEERAATLGRFLRLAASLIGLGAAALALLAGPILALLYGPDFAPARPVLEILALGLVPLAIKVILVQGLKAVGETGAIARIEAVTVATSATALLALVPALGIVGAAWSFALAQAAGGFFAAWRTARALGLPAWRLFRPTADDWRRVRASLERPR